MSSSAPTASTSSLARSSLVMAAGTLVSRVLGVARYTALVWVIGSSTPVADAWQNANTLPNTIYMLLAAGVLNVVLLPQITRALRRGEEGQDYTDRLLTLALTVLVAGTALFVAAAPLLAKVYALDWPWGSPLLRLTILFAYLCIPQMLFYGLHTLMGQILAAHQRFAAFMWSPALNNVIVILGLVVFSRVYPHAQGAPPERWTASMILLLAVPATLGIVVQALVLVPAVRATGFTFRPRWGFRGVGLGSASRMTGWALADVGTSQLGLLVATNVINWASRSMPGAPGKLGYDLAFSAFILPHSLIALSLLTALYPVLARAAADDDREEMARQTVQGLSLLGAVMVPIAVAMILLAEPFLRVIYPSLPAHDAGQMAWILIALTLGLVPYGVYLVCSRVFYSFEDGRTPYLFQLSITGVLIVVVLVALTRSPMTAAATVGLGQALGQTTAAVLGLRAVRRTLPTLGVRRLARTYLRALAAALVAAVPAWLVARLVRALVPGPTGPAATGAPGTDGAPHGAGAHAWLPAWTEAVLTLAVAGLVFLAVYAVAAHLLGLRELSEAAAPLLRRLGLGRVVASPAQPEAAPTVAPTAPAAGPAPTDPSGEPAPTAPAGAPVARTVGAGSGTLGWGDTPHGAQARKDGNMDGLTEGEVLGGRYALEELLARHQEGTLDYWSARDTTLDRLVAVTVLTADGQGRAGAVLDAARRVASVDDPRLVRVLDVGSADGTAWIVEEGLTDAESLASLVAEDVLPAEESRRLVGEAAAALESARRRGLHHLYLNPHSLLRAADGGVKVSGVGVAAALEGVEDITADEASLIDTSDLVSLLYAGLTGHWPGEDLAGVRPARRLADGTLPAPSEVVSGVPGDLDTLCRLVLGADADLSTAPHTPGDLARVLSPWSSEPVRQARGAGRGSRGLTGPAAGEAAATVAGGVPDGEDHTQRVPRATYYRTTSDGSGPRTATGHGPADATARAAGATAAGSRTWSPAGRTATSDPEAADTAADGLPEERASFLQTGVVLLLIVALVALAAGLAWGALKGVLPGHDSSATSTPSSTAPGAPGTAAGSTATSSRSAAASGSSASAGGTGAPSGSTGSAPAAGGGAASGAAGEGLAVQGIASFDPEGSGNEHNDLAPLAVDGKAGTAWRSYTYATPGWGGLKDGTGLILDLGDGATVSGADVLLGKGDVSARLLLADKPTLAGATELAKGEGVNGTWQAKATTSATGRYLILWFDQAAKTAAGEQVQVREITVH